MTVFDDGSGPALYVGGGFVTAGGVLVNGISRWDGTKWSALTGPSGTGLKSGFVLALTVFDDGSGPALFVAGVFTTAGGVLANYIAKWDGETWSALAGPSGVGVNNSIHALAVFDDGTGPALFAGGEFTAAGGIVVNRIAKWDGKSWSALSTSGGTGVSGDVLALSTYDDGGGVALYAGGRFVSAGGLLVNRIARWDGSDWSGLSGPSGIGVDGRVDALTVFGTGDEAALIVGGSIGAAGGVWVSEIAKWNGSEWSALADPSENDINGPVAALMVFDDGNGAALYAGGGFTSIGGSPADGVARWTGEEWSALVGPTGFGVNESVVALAAFDDGSGAKLFAGGNFTTMGGMPMSWITKWNGDSWSTIAERSGLGLDHSVLALGLFEIGEDSALYVGGYLKSAGGIPLNGIAKWDEGLWSDLSGPAATGVTGPVWALSVFDDGGGPALFAAGSFESAGGVLVSRVAKWNGTEWSALTGSSGTGVAGGSVNALTVFDDGSGAALYVGGSFTTAGGVQVNRIAKWDGTEWSALAGPSGTGVDGTVNALAVFDDGNGPALFVGGNFLRAGGVLTHRIAKWDGNQWTALAGPSGTGVTDEVRALTVFDGGDGPSLFAGGVFLFAGGVRVDRIARWDGSNWSPLDGPEGTGVNSGGILSLAAVDDGTGPALYAGGSFTMAGGIPARHIARWSGDAWTPLEGLLGNGVDGDVRAIAGHEVTDGSVLFAGGSFSEAGGLASSRIASYSCLLDQSTPVNPVVQSTSPPTGSWSNDSTAEVTFSGAVDDPSGSGVAGYSVLFDQNPTTAPDDAIDIQHTADPHAATSEPLSDGDDWFFHLSTCDFAGNCSSAIHTGPFRIDTSSPSAPGPVTSPSHDGGPSNDPTIDVAWTAASDPLSGVAGYRYDFAETATPPACASLSSTTISTSATSATLADGTWYAHVCAFDNAGNVGEVTSGGPYEIDTAAPSAPGPVTSQSHDGGPSNDATIEVEWTAATDPLSAVAGYRYDFAETPAPPTCASLTSTTTSTSATSETLADGTWYAHVCAFDNAGNFGEVTSGGPYEIDTTAAAVESVGSVPDSGDGVLVDGEVVLGGTTRLLVRWSDAMADPSGDSDPEDVTNPANYRLVGAGSDGSIASGVCAPAAGDDVEWPFTAAEYDATNEASTLRLAGPLAIPADLYRISICGTIEDDAGNPATAASLDFRILGSDLLAQPNFDGDLAGWTVDDPFPGSLLWSPDDAGGEGSSGSAEVMTPNGAGVVWTLSQCVAVDAPRWLGRFRVRTASSTPDQPEVILQAEWFAESDCEGTGLGTASAPPVTGDTGDAWLESVHDGGVPPGAASARIAVVVTGGTASTFTAAVDDLFHGNPFMIFIDGFETATTERWSATVPLATRVR